MEEPTFEMKDCCPGFTYLHKENIVIMDESGFAKTCIGPNTQVMLIGYCPFCGIKIKISKVKEEKPVLY